MLSLQRSGRLALQLAAHLGSRTYTTPAFHQALTASSPRFRYVNLQAESVLPLETVLKILLGRSTPRSLTQLSLRIEASPYTRVPSRSAYIFESDPTYRSAFENIVNSLRILRLRSVRFRMDNITFKNLVELRIQDVQLGDDAALEAFLLALTPESQIRTLEIISVTTHRGDTVRSGDPSRLSLPSLESLYLEDLYLNVIQTVLRIIAPGEYRFAFTPSDQYLSILTRHGNLPSGTGAFKNAIKDHAIDTLLFGQFWSSSHVGPIILPLLRSIPTLTTMHIDDQLLDQETLAALTRPYDSTGPAFPRLTKLFISRSVIDDIGDQTAFKTMISSHPLQEIAIGGSFGEVLDIDSTNTDYETVDIDGPDVRLIPVKNWLKATVPKVTFPSPGLDIRFQSDIWQLW
ncbi:hypothetical protein FRC11_006184 [Ceratobasidium sp. 423]|nr:hypothetical protein FRC11_006184 [Ceratobasidium sp. 423]